MRKRIVCFALAVLMLSQLNVLAMPTSDFDAGMAKGISYFNRGLYYEAKDEFQWFCDFNWDKMNSGQQKYALDYLGGTKQRITIENSKKKKTKLDNTSREKIDTFSRTTDRILERIDRTTNRLSNMLNRTKSIMENGSVTGDMWDYIP